MEGVIVRPPMVLKAQGDIYLLSEMLVGRMDGWMDGEDLM